MNPMILSLLTALTGGKSGGGNDVLTLLTSLLGGGNLNSDNGGQNGLNNMAQSLMGAFGQNLQNSGQNPQGQGTDKTNILLSLLPALLNANKPVRKEDEYLKEAEKMFGSSCGTGQCSAMNTSEKQQNIANTFEEIKGFSTNEVNEALCYLHDCQKR